MTTKYITKDGDVLDWVCSKHYGALDNRQFEQVLEANPGLADLGAVLSGGIEVVLPDLVAPATVQGTRLWD